VSQLDSSEKTGGRFGSGRGLKAVDLQLMTRRRNCVARNPQITEHAPDQCSKRVGEVRRPKQSGGRNGPPLPIQL